MDRMTYVDQSDPLEIRVLATLTSGTATVADVARRTGQAESVVGPILEQAVAEETVTRINLAKAPAYSLTPKGLHAVGVSQGVPGAVDSAGHVDPVVATQIPVAEHDVTTDDAAADAAAIDNPVTEVPPAPPPTGIGPVSGAPQVKRVDVDPELRKVQWRHVVYAAAYVLLGLFLLLFQPVVGLVALAAGLVLGGFSLRPLFRTGPARVTSR